MSTLICGSIAYDTIMVFGDYFKNHILPEQIHILNVAFLVPDMRREYGGCAGNIAYNLNMLGGDPVIMATVGDDFSPYEARLKKLKLSRKCIKTIPETFTAQAFITTDLADNQITAFHPGAMNFSHENHVSHAENISVGIVAPDGRKGMLQHAQEFSDGGIPFIFDPGQGLPMFNGDELMNFIRLASYVALNDYEARLLQEKTGKKIEEVAKLVDAVVVTRGGEGSTIYMQSKRVGIPSVRPEKVIDPTGCGDAYRAGLLYGIEHDLDLELAGKLASLLGSLKIAARGAQNHSFTKDEVVTKFREHFGIQL
jgi:adenosine kinase